MAEFKEYPVGELVVNFDRMRKPLSSREREKRKGVYPYYGATCIFDYIDDYIFDGEYILLGEDGTVINKDGSPVLQRISGKTWVNNHAHILRNTDIIDFDYLYYALKNANFTGAVTGAVQPKISQANMNAVRIKIHASLDEQRQVASILKALDDKIALNTAINNNLEQQAFALLDYMFPLLSKGTAHIGDYITPKRGKGLLSKDAVEGKVPVVAGGLEPATYHNKANTKAPVLTISASGANAGYVKLWGCDVWSSDSSYIDSTMTNHVYFWYAVLKKRQKEIFDSQTGSAQPHIYPQHIAVLPITSLDQQDIGNYTELVEPLFTLIGENIRENESLSALRDSLLPKLMSGEIDIFSLKV